MLGVRIGALFCLLFASPVFAYTYFVDIDPQGNKQVAHWPSDKFPLHYVVDKEPTNVEGQDPQTLVEAALNLWNHVPGANVSFQLTHLSEDIHSKNFADKVKIGDGRVDIVIEQDGKLLETLGLDARFVAGIGVPVTANHTTLRPDLPIYGTIVDGFVVVNTQQTATAERFKRLVAHEIGHTLGLAHSNIAHLDDPDHFPIMFFDPTQTGKQTTLHQDDRSGLATLYPHTAVFEQNYGAIQGQVKARSGQVVFGLAVIATPQSNQHEPIGTWTDEQGMFFLTGLPPESYTLHIRPINGTQVVNQMDARQHIGGIYRNAVTHFCPEFYNDRVFDLCRTTPAIQDRLLVRVGQSLDIHILREDRDNPAPEPLCVWGALLSFPHRLVSAFPAQVSGGGIRGAACPVASLPERFQEFWQETTETTEKIVIPDQMVQEDSTEPQVVLPTCGCQHTTWASFWLVGVILLLVVGRFQKGLAPNRSFGRRTRM